MIIVLHGDNQAASRERFITLREEAQKKGANTVLLDGKSTTWEQIELQSQTTTLLGEESNVFIENFFTGKKAKGIVPKDKIEGEIVFWESQELSRTLLLKLTKNWKIEFFEFPKLVFRMLDANNPEKPAASLKLLQEVLARQAPESVLPLLAWHTRQLIWAKEEPETLASPSWKKQKLIGQASLFTPGQLYDLHKKLLDLDKSQKTSTNPLPLSSSLDLLIASQ